MAFSSNAAAEVCKILKRLQIIGTAVGIARVVHGIHPQHESIRTSRFGEAESDRNEHGVSPWDIRIRDDALLHAARGKSLGVIGE
jgi:hypothetical protein